MWRIFLTPEQIAAREAYQQAEATARETLREQMNDGKGSPTARHMQSEEMTNNMTGYVSWKINNAEVVKEREEQR